MAPKNDDLDDRGWREGDEDPLLGEAQRLGLGGKSVKSSFNQGSTSEHATRELEAEGTFEIGDKFRTAKAEDINFRWIVTAKNLSHYEITKEHARTYLKPEGPVNPEDIPDFIDYDALDLGPIGPGKIQGVTQFELEYGAWIQEGDKVVYDMDNQVIDVGRAIVDSGTGNGGRVVFIDKKFGDPWVVQQDDDILLRIPANAARRLTATLPDISFDDLQLPVDPEPEKPAPTQGFRYDIGQKFFDRVADKIEITDRTRDGKGNTAKYKLGGESFWVTNAEKFTNVWVTEAAIESQLAFDKFFTSKKKFMKWANKQDDPTKWIPAKWLAEVDKPDPVMQERFTWAIGDKFYKASTPTNGKIWVQQGMYGEREGNPNARSYQLWYEDED